jgi:hypothetical protein
MYFNFGRFTFAMMHFVYAIVSFGGNRAMSTLYSALTNVLYLAVSDVRISFLILQRRQLMPPHVAVVRTVCVLLASVFIAIE